MGRRARWRQVGWGRRTSEGGGYMERRRRVEGGRRKVGKWRRVEGGISSN